MRDTNVSRRGFVKGAVAGAALGTLATTSVAMAGQTPDIAEALMGQADDVKSVKITPSLCNACPNQCGERIFSVKGKYWKVLGQKDHPYSRGHLCTRGYGYPLFNYSEGRLKQPLKRVGDKRFEPISWEDAFREIGSVVGELSRKGEAQSIYMVQDNRASKQMYGARLMGALGASNYFTDSANSNLGLLAASLAVIGTALNPDTARSKYIVMLGKSYGETFRPHEPHELAEAKENGATIVFIDPRLDETSSLVDVWVPVKAGTELAFLLGLCNWLIEHNKYDKSFIEQYAHGFDEFAAGVKEYTAKRVAELCNIDERFVEEVASGLAEHAPASLVENTWNGIYGAAYHNTPDTVRTVVLLNALLGNFNQKGGECILRQPVLANDGGKVKALPKLEPPRNAYNYPLSGFLGGSVAEVFKAIESKEVKALFVHGCNIVRDFTSYEYAQKRLAEVPFKVCIGLVQDETAELCDYILPETSYLERQDVVQSFGGFHPAIAMRVPAVDKIYEDTKSFDEIYSGLAKACSVGEYFDFTLDEFNEARLEPLKAEGIEYATLKENGYINGFSNGLEYGKVGGFWTPSQKIEFASTNFEKAGLGKVPQFKEAQIPEEQAFRLITGEQCMHNHTSSIYAQNLIELSKHYKLDRLWINRQVADELGIKESDKVTLSSKQATTVAYAYPTQCIEKSSVYLPLHYGSTLDHKSVEGFGTDPALHRTLEVEPATGALCFNEVFVTLKKGDK